MIMMLPGWSERSERGIVCVPSRYCACSESARNGRASLGLPLAVGSLSLSAPGASGWRPGPAGGRSLTSEPERGGRAGLLRT
jgi:hypothetical protein